MVLSSRFGCFGFFVTIFLASLSVTIFGHEICVTVNQPTLLPQIDFSNHADLFVSFSFSRFSMSDPDADQDADTGGGWEIVENPKITKAKVKENAKVTNDNDIINNTKHPNCSRFSENRLMKLTQEFCGSSIP